MKTTPKPTQAQILYMSERLQAYKKLQDLYEKELPLNAEEKSRIDSYMPEEGETKTQMWVWFATRMRERLKEDYQDGEIEFQNMLQIIRNCSLGLNAERRLFFLGTMSDFGLRTQPKITKRKSGERKAITARWLKRMLIELFDDTKRKFPDINDFSYPNKNKKDSIYRIVTDFIRPLQIGDLPSERTFEKWLGEPENKKLQPYRSSKKRPKDKKA